MNNPASVQEINTYEETNDVPVVLVDRDQSSTSTSAETKINDFIHPNCMDGNTPLHQAAGKGDIYIVRKFVQDDGYDIMAKNNDGDTPLHRAAFGGSLSTVCTLVDEFKCDPNTKGMYGRTPMHQAAQRGHIDIVRNLLSDYGSDVNAVDKYGQTSLYYAITWRYINPLMIAELIRYNGHPGKSLKGYNEMEKSLHHTVSGLER